MSEGAKAPRPDELAEVQPLLVCEKAAAKLIGMRPSSLISGRFRGRPILPYVKMGPRAIRYRLAEIHEYIDRNTVSSGK